MVIARDIKGNPYYDYCERMGESGNALTGRKVCILGDKWIIHVTKEEDDPKLKEMDGYTDWTTKRIVVCDVERDLSSVSDLEAYKRKVLRHEIVHAFLLESGLDECSADVSGWARNEEMIDWFARQGEKIYNAWVQAGAI